MRNSCMERRLIKILVVNVSVVKRIIDFVGYLTLVCHLHNFHLCTMENLGNTDFNFRKVGIRPNVVAGKRYPSIDNLILKNNVH